MPKIDPRLSRAIDELFTPLVALRVQLEAFDQAVKAAGAAMRALAAIAAGRQAAATIASATQAAGPLVLAQQDSGQLAGAISPAHAGDAALGAWARAYQSYEKYVRALAAVTAASRLATDAGRELGATLNQFTLAARKLAVPFMMMADKLASAHAPAVRAALGDRRGEGAAMRGAVGHLALAPAMGAGLEQVRRHQALASHVAVPPALAKFQSSAAQATAAHSQFTAAVSLVETLVDGLGQLGEAASGTTLLLHGVSGAVPVLGAGASKVAGALGIAGGADAMTEAVAGAGALGASVTAAAALGSALVGGFAGNEIYQHLIKPSRFEGWLAARVYDERSIVKLKPRRSHASVTVHAPAHVEIHVHGGEAGADHHKVAAAVKQALDDHSTELARKVKDAVDRQGTIHARTEFDDDDD
jgi:hypothetical protein